jgi:hypothetical protein
MVPGFIAGCQQMQLAHFFLSSDELERAALQGDEQPK